MDNYWANLESGNTFTKQKNQKKKTPKNKKKNKQKKNHFNI